MKVIELTFKDGERWEIPLEFVAKHRTEYYKSKREDDFNYQEEVDFVMTDDYEGKDWLKNNMNFEDFKDVVKIIPNDKPATKDWRNAESTIIEKETRGKENNE